MVQFPHDRLDNRHRDAENHPTPPSGHKRAHQLEACQTPPAGQQRQLLGANSFRTSTMSVPSMRRGRGNSWLRGNFASEGTPPPSTTSLAVGTAVVRCRGASRSRLRSRSVSLVASQHLFVRNDNIGGVGPPTEHLRRQTRGRDLCATRNLRHGTPRHGEWPRGLAAARRCAAARPFWSF